jgi:ESCRT-II complex subunit VPS36
VLTKTLAKRSWENVSAAKAITTAAALPAKQFSASNAGVSGIIRRQEKALQSVDTLAKTALSDLESLMQTAREVISVVERYAALVSSNDNEDQASSVGSRSEASSVSGGTEVNEMETIMQNIGIVSPVTKFSAGRSYHKLLARQLADLLLHQGRLQRLGGLITLTDLYCIFNRARGTELVSPDDMLQACELCEKLQLGMALRVFASGVKVLQLESCSDGTLSKEITVLLTDNAQYSKNGISASELSHHLHMSLAIAKELLLLEEQHCRLCRDESIHGISFFQNTYFI